ncbi:unnamed protein product [Rhizophagus irregularis]|nr:unnamed protein product [Rhizophagus irregularis]
MPPEKLENKRSCSAISDDIKRQICEWAEANKNAKHAEIAKHFNEKYSHLEINCSTVSKILTQRDKWKVVLDNEISNRTYKHKPKFKKRNNICKFCIYGESGSVPLASLPEEIVKLQQILSRFTLDQIYNIDETVSLYYRMALNQTLSTKPVRGQKKDKTRVTVLLKSNATGTDKLKPWVIGNLKRPRHFSKVNLNRLPVYYCENLKTWMNSLVFKEVLREMDSHFRAQNKKILLLIDNAPSHFDPNYLPASEKIKLQEIMVVVVENQEVIDQEAMDQEVIPYGVQSDDLPESSHVNF